MEERVRQSTSSEQKREIDEELRKKVEQYANKGREAIDQSCISFRRNVW